MTTLERLKDLRARAASILDSNGEFTDSDRECIARELVTIAKKELPKELEDYKFTENDPDNPNPKGNDRDGDGKKNEPKPDFLKKGSEGKRQRLTAAATFKCPECGTKVLEQTSYCVKCKKKVKKASDDLDKWLRDGKFDDHLSEIQGHVKTIGALWDRSGIKAKKTILDDLTSIEYQVKRFKNDLKGLSKAKKASSTLEDLKSLRAKAASILDSNGEFTDSDREYIARELVTIAKKEVPEAFKKEWKNTKLTSERSE